MTWHDRIENIVSQRARLQKCHFERVYEFWNQTILKSISNFFPGKLFFRHWAVRSWASQTDPEFWPSHKKVHNKTPLYSTRVSTVARTMPDFVNFLSWNCLNLKFYRNMFFISINRHFDTIFYSKFIYILTISGQILLKAATVYFSANSILREQRTKSQSFKVEQKI